MSFFPLNSASLGAGKRSQQIHSSFLRGSGKAQSLLVITGKVAPPAAALSTPSGGPGYQMGGGKARLMIFCDLQGDSWA
jgi:hypothetical protein